MCKIEIATTEIDDPKFVAVVSSVINYYANLYKTDTAYVVHIDNWFGDRWVGFCGKILGAAGVRNRSVNDCVLPSPPFIPSRIKSALTFERIDDSEYSIVSKSYAGLHAYKSGSEFWNLRRPGLYSWYSGNTISNSSGSLMVYEVTREGSSGWYLGFDRDPNWRPTRSKNIALSDCENILNARNKTQTL